MLKLFKSWTTHMDYKGQKLAEQLFQAIIILFAVVGFIWGYMCEQFVQTMYVLGAGFVLSCILTLPPWPMYRRSPIEWLKPRPEENSEDISKDKDKKQIKKKSKSK
ncbi:signal peptidase complex subunit 1-like [Saccoglossus kowalevskii]|uniref:Signal peptidase complex subunit 1 n=1 Tax=Saccoglossus kowalevskii TaxID=10224 RepID=A0ABM0GN59_SACKO|nr:PREDICTED: signal peptidase complex subunit 1-like [Saccoglossus kowalevskii]